jgi:hypothetical protein
MDSSRDRILTLRLGARKWPERVVRRAGDGLPARSLPPTAAPLLNPPGPPTQPASKSGSFPCSPLAAAAHGPRGATTHRANAAHQALRRCRSSPFQGDRLRSPITYSPASGGGPVGEPTLQGSSHTGGAKTATRVRRQSSNRSLLAGGQRRCARPARRALPKEPTSKQIHRTVHASRHASRRKSRYAGRYEGDAGHGGCATARIGLRRSTKHTSQGDTDA